MSKGSGFQSPARHVSQSFSTALIACTVSFLASACQPQPVPQDGADASTQAASEGSPESRMNVTLPGVPPPMTATPTATAFTGLKLIEDRTDELGQRHQRYQQYFLGVPVWPGDSTLHLNPQGQVYQASGEILKIDDTFSIEPGVAAARAAAAAQNAIEGDWQSEQTRLVIVNTDQHPVLAWQVDVSRGLKRRAVLIDAHSGALIKVIEKTWS